MKKYIASVSWGKDSLCMLLGLMERGLPLDEVVYYDTGMEFKAIYDTRDQVLPLLTGSGIKCTELKPDIPFLYKMFTKPVNGRNGLHYGYSWCGGRCRWGTTDKLRSLDCYAQRQNAIVYVGIAADEQKRLERLAENKIAPLAEWSVTEAEALSYCYDHGYEWLESGYRLYDLLDRVSCWCCANKNLKELRNYYLYLPEYWERLKYLQSRTERPMKGAGKSVYELEKRFQAERQK